MLAVRRPSHGAVLFAWSGGVLFALSLAYFLYSYLIRFGESGHAAATSPGATLRPATLDIVMFSAFALHHSIAARPWIKRRIERLVTPTLERSLYTWTASALFIVTCALWQHVPGELYRLTGMAALPGYLMQLLGIAFTARSSARLDVLDLAGVRPVLEGRQGDAAPRHVPLETRGLYRFVRHPLYFAWLLVVFGAPHMTMTRLVFAVVSSAYLAIAIPFEERSLIHTFGADYRKYQEQVRWRLIPGIY